MTQQTVLERPAEHRHRSGLSLAVLVTCQLMVVLDASVVFVAMPKIQHSLHFSNAGLSWVANAYGLAFGGLLLLGGRAGDILGRRRVFVAGIALFTLASLLGGLAPSAGLLLAARAAQGVGAALAAPSALALITTNFAEGPERNRALSIFSATSSGGASIGMIVGGMLTDWVSWRWVLIINVPVGIVVLFAAPMILAETERHRGRLDLAGAITAVGGVTSLVYGFIRAADHGWGDGVTVGSFVGGALLLAVFVAVEMRAQQPVVPLRLLADRARAGSYLNMLLLASAMFGMFFFVVQFLQNNQGYSPLQAGLGFLPMTVVLFTMARLAPRLIPRFGPRRMMLTGMPLIALGLLWLTRLSSSSGYVTGVFGPFVLFGLGAGLTFLPLTMSILSGVRPADSGAASGLLQTTQQVGGSVGLAVLATVYGTAARDGGLTHGVSVAFTAATAFIVVALAVAFLVIRPRRT